MNDDEIKKGMAMKLVGTMAPTKAKNILLAVISDGSYGGPVYEAILAHAEVKVERAPRKIRSDKGKSKGIAPEPPTNSQV